MKKLLVILIFGLLSSSFAQKLELVWQTDTVFQKPESVIYNPSDNFIYVANINGEDAGVDGNGFISRIHLDGSIENLHWVTGLDGPKGMGIFNGKLYVADITKVVVINIKSATIEATYTAPGSIFLNDITIDKKGKVYISDSHAIKVYALENKKLDVWFEEKKFLLPNGLLVKDENLLLADMDAGKLFSINTTTKKVTELANGAPKCDGINTYKNEYILSCWPGEVYVTNKGTSVKLLDTKNQNLNAADAWYIAEKNLFLIPTFFGNNIAAYSFQ